MKEHPMSMLTLRIDDKLDKQLNELSKATGKSRSDIAREAIKSQVFLTRLEALRAKGVPMAQAQGILTDEDVFALVS
jgi:predicted transcriptional regulator